MLGERKTKRSGTSGLVTNGVEKPGDRDARSWRNAAPAGSGLLVLDVAGCLGKFAQEATSADILELAVAGNPLADRLTGNAYVVGTSTMGGSASLEKPRPAGPKPWYELCLCTDCVRESLPSRRG